jgi:hypothetical protein
MPRYTALLLALALIVIGMIACVGLATGHDGIMADSAFGIVGFIAGCAAGKTFKLPAKK